MTSGVFAKPNEAPVNTMLLVVVPLENVHVLPLVLPVVALEKVPDVEPWTGTASAYTALALPIARSTAAIDLNIANGNPPVVLSLRHAIFQKHALKVLPVPEP